VALEKLPQPISLMQKNSNNLSVIGRAWVNLAGNMPPKSGTYVVQYMRMGGYGGLDTIVSIVNESEPFNFLYKKNQETNWIKNS
jgi:hypothetical protein